MMPLFDVNMPANAGHYFNVLYQVVAFDFFDVGYHYHEMFDLETSDPINISY